MAGKLAGRPVQITASGTCFPARGLPQSGSKGLSQSLRAIVANRINTPSECAVRQIAEAVVISAMDAYSGDRDRWFRSIVTGRAA